MLITIDAEKAFVEIGIEVTSQYSQRHLPQAHYKHYAP